MKNYRSKGTMSQSHSSGQPIAEPNHSFRSRLSLKEELLLAIAPTLTILSVMALVEWLSRQHLLFASLAASAFLIYLDPHHSSNTARTLSLSQLIASTIGLLANFILGAGYNAGAVAMLVTIVFMIVLDIVHPPAVSTALSFAFLAGSKNNLALFSLAVVMIALLVGLQRLSLWMLTRFK